MKLFVLGLDGASYRLICKFMEEGKLPEFSRLKKEGYFQRMGTTVPPHTAPGWTSLFTGTGPGQHGIYQFWDTQAAGYCGGYMGSTHLAVPGIWEILNARGLRTALVNIPMTYPPKELNGINITWPLANTLRYAYPPDILRRLSEYGGHYASDINVMFQGNLDYIDQALEVTEKRVRTIKYLIEEETWDLCISVFTEIDRISHFYWQFYDSQSPAYDAGAEKKYQNAIRNIYVETDWAIGEIRRMLPEDTEFMMVSDHGFTRGTMDFYIQTFLMQNSFLYLKKLEVKSSSTDSNWLYTQIDGKEYEVDFAKTKAYLAAPGSYGVNLNVKGRQKNGIIPWSRYEEERERLIKLLKEVSYPDTGEKLFRSVSKREEVYHGNCVTRAPDVILIPKDYGVMVHHKICRDTLFGLPEQKGMHDEDAVFAYCGTKGRLQQEPLMHWEDVAPTVLDIFGLKAPDYMEGKSRFIPGLLFRQDAAEQKAECGMEIQKTEEVQIYSENEKQEVSEKLKLLGYL